MTIKTIKQKIETNSISTKKELVNGVLEKMIPNSKNKNLNTKLKKIMLDLVGELEEENAKLIKKLESFEKKDKPNPKEVNTVSARPFTYGEKLVGLTFNVGNNPIVNDIKQNFANLIDYLHNIEINSISYQQREFAKDAIKDCITAQMICVKTETWKD